MLGALLARHRATPPGPDLLAESEQREAAGAAAAHGITGYGHQPLPDNGDGIDKTVFGPYRKACRDDADYQHPGT